MVLIGEQIQGYDMARYHIRELRAQDAYIDDAVIPDPVIPTEARNRRRKSTGDNVVRRFESIEARTSRTESSWCECARPKRQKKSDQTPAQQGELSRSQQRPSEMVSRPPINNNRVRDRSNSNDR